MIPDLSGRTALVTGASRGIGAAIARALDGAGARVAVCARTEEALAPVVAELGNDPVIVAGDLALAAEPARIAERAALELGAAVDVLVNNAGVGARPALELVDAELIDRLYAVNVRAPLLLIQALAPGMIERGGGSVISLSSVSGVVGTPRRSAYAATKGAIDAMTRSLAAELGPHGIRLNSVAPGVVDTDMWAQNKAVPGVIEQVNALTPLRRWAAPEDIADAVVFLASDAARFVTGETIRVDGGMARTLDLYAGAGDEGAVDLRLNGKRAVVTGASRGIGLAVARALAAEGARVALVARDEEALRRAADVVCGEPVVAACDTGDPESVAAMASVVTSELGGVEILVNCAARANTGPMADDELAEQINVKVAGYLRCARAFAPQMAERGWGRIINVSGLAARSTGSVVGSVRNVAVSAMTKNLADEYGASGVNVTVVHPGMTVTERFGDTLAAMAGARGVSPVEMEASLARATSIGRVVTAEEVADVITFLASPRSVAVTGDAIAAGGGSRGAIYY